MGSETQSALMLSLAATPEVPADEHQEHRAQRPLARALSGLEPRSPCGTGSWRPLESGRARLRRGPGAAPPDRLAPRGRCRPGGRGRWGCRARSGHDHGGDAVPAADVSHRGALRELARDPVEGRQPAAHEVRGIGRTEEAGAATNAEADMTPHGTGAAFKAQTPRPWVVFWRLVQ